MQRRKFIPTEAWLLEQEERTRRLEKGRDTRKMFGKPTKFPNRTSELSPPMKRTKGGKPIVLRTKRNHSTTKTLSQIKKDLRKITARGKRKMQNRGAARYGASTKIWRSKSPRDRWGVLKTKKNNPKKMKKRKEVKHR
jgi:hypothetical protein